MAVAGATQVPPPPPRKLKRSASAASLPSPPPSVQPPKKRANRLRPLGPKTASHVGDSDVEEEDGEEDEDDDERANVVGRKILFPAVSLASGPEVFQTTEEDPFVVRSTSPMQDPKGLLVPASPVRRSPRLQAAAKLTSAPSTPVKSKPRRCFSQSPVRRSIRISVNNYNEKENKGKCRADELPVRDETEDNPFLVKTPSPKNKTLRSKKSAKETVAENVTAYEEKDAKLGRDEKPTITYVLSALFISALVPLSADRFILVFSKGVKTHLPNPYYNLSPSAYAKAQLPLDHPDFEPLPLGPSQLKLKPKKRKNRTMNGEDKGEGSSNHLLSSEEDEDDPSANDRSHLDGDAPTNEDSSPPPEPRTPDNKPRIKYSGFKSESGKPLPDSGPEGVRGAVMDADEIGRMAVGPIRDRSRGWKPAGGGGEMDI